MTRHLVTLAIGIALSVAGFSDAGGETTTGAAEWGWRLCFALMVVGATWGCYVALSTWPRTTRVLVTAGFAVVALLAVVLDWPDSRPMILLMVGAALTFNSLWELVLGGRGSGSPGRLPAP